MLHDVLKEHFRSDFSTLMGEFVIALEDLMKGCDVVIFVARRAYTLYEALVFTGCIGQHSECRVLSSRACSFEAPSFEGKTVAIIDDVMVAGDAMRTTCFYLQGEAKECEALVAASCSASSEDEVAQKGVRLHVLRRLEKSDVYELTREINGFVQAAGLTNNIDQPEFLINLPSDLDLRDVLDGHEWFDCTTDTQRDNGILSATITYDAKSLPYQLPLPANDFDGVLTKIRAISRLGSRSAVLLPFVVLPNLDERRVDAMYDWLVDAGLCRDAASVNRNHSKMEDAARNKIRVVQYFLSRQLGIAAIASMPEVSAEVLEDREDVLFGMRLSNPGLVSSLTASSCQKAELHVEGIRWFGRKGIARRIRAEYLKEDMLRAKTGATYSCFSVSDLHGHIGKFLSKHDWEHTQNRSEAVRVATSVCLDYLIDCGILVPMLKDESGSIVRAYRSGEIECLSILEMELFAHAVSACLESLKWAKIRCTTVNRLAVLFSREMKRAVLAGIHDDTGIFDFARSIKGDLRQLPGDGSYEMELLSEVLVSDGHLEWANKQKTSLKAGAPCRDLREYGISGNGMYKVEAAFEHLSDYLSLAGADGADDLLNTLIMKGSRRYVLGVVADRLGKARSTLDRLLFPAKIADTYVPDPGTRDQLEKEADELAERCDWALGEGECTFAGTKTLEKEYEDVARLLRSKFNRGDLMSIIEEDAFRQDSDRSLADGFISEARDFAQRLKKLPNDSSELRKDPPSVRLLSDGEVLSQKLSILLGQSVVKHGRFSVSDYRIGVIALLPKVGSSQVEYKLFKRSHGKVLEFELRSIAPKEGDTSWPLVLVFTSDDVGPHAVLWAGEERVWHLLNGLEHFSRIQSKRMNKAIRALFSKHGRPSSYQVAICRPAEEMIPGTTDTRDLLPKAKDGKWVVSDDTIVIDTNVADMFRKCGAEVSLHAFDVE